MIFSTFNRSPWITAASFKCAALSPSLQATRSQSAALMPPTRRLHRPPGVHSRRIKLILAAARGRRSRRRSSTPIAMLQAIWRINPWGQWLRIECRSPPRRAVNAGRQRLRVESPKAESGCGWRQRHEQQRRTGKHRRQGMAREFACHDRSSIGWEGLSVIGRLPAGKGSNLPRSRARVGRIDAKAASRGLAPKARNPSENSSSNCGPPIERSGVAASAQVKPQSSAPTP